MLAVKLGLNFASGVFDQQAALRPIAYENEVSVLPLDVGSETVQIDRMHISKNCLNKKSKYI